MLINLKGPINVNIAMFLRVSQYSPGAKGIFGAVWGQLCVHRERGCAVKSMSFADERAGKMGR